MRLVPASRRRRQAGLTLIELVVVLLVLTALAGVLIPFATQITQRTHGSAGAANIEETTKSITRFEVERFRHPNNWDSLLDGAAGTVYTNIPNVAGELLPGNLTAAHAAALNASSIFTAVNMNDATTDATFAPYDGTSTSLLTGATVCFADSVAVARELGADPDPDAQGDNDDYVAFGIGTFSDMIGVTMVDAPVYFPEGDSPIDVYARFMAVYQVNGVPGPARFVGVCTSDDSGLRGLGSHLEDYYEAVQ